ncbi:MAG TPA: neutral/alkaline non-lysosomal ceramidase N-terminal domain-containing protein [Limnochordia bacterium]|nr:neutral/alkaline non-lysosomal ceramidase N-terminal domain-containing protein [Limnochordia bacterium]
MRLGIGKAVITPPLGTNMGGYGHRDHGAEAVLDDLEVRVFWLSDETPDKASTATPAACLVCADLIGFDAELTAAIRADLGAQFGLPPEAVLLAASHTHSGPQTCLGMVKAGGAADPAYVVTLRQAIGQAVAAARQDQRPVTLAAGRGRLEGYAINRRVIVDGKATMAPNPDGVRDDDVTVLAFRDAAEYNVIGLLFHYTCHPTLMGDYRLSADYPGAARRRLEREFPGAACAFLPGCFGDVRPDCTLVGRKRFRRGEPADVDAFGAALAAEAARVAREACVEVTPRLAARSTWVELPFAAAPQTGRLSLQRLDLADRVRLAVMGGEICVDYGHFVKSLSPGDFWLGVGYANGMLGYVPSARLFPQGGYEVDGSYAVFGLPSPFQPAIDPLLREALTHLLDVDH